MDDQSISLDLELNIDINLRDKIIKQLTNFDLKNNSQLLTDLKNLPNSSFKDESNKSNYLKISLFKLNQIIDLLSKEQGYQIFLNDINNLNKLDDLKKELDADKINLINHLISLEAKKVKFNDNQMDDYKLDNFQVNEIDGCIDCELDDDIEIIGIKNSNDNLDGYVDCELDDDIEIVEVIENLNDYLDDSKDCNLNFNKPIDQSIKLTSSKQQIPLISSASQKSAKLSKILNSIVSHVSVSQKSAKSSKILNSIASTSSASQKSAKSSKILNSIASTSSVSQNSISSTSSVSQKSATSKKELRNRQKHIKMKITEKDKRKVMKLWKENERKNLNDSLLKDDKYFYLATWIMKNVQYDENTKETINKKEFLRMLPSTINGVSLDGIFCRSISLVLKYMVKGANINGSKRFYSKIKILNNQ